MKTQGLTARQVQYMKADPNRRQEVPAGPPSGLYLVVHPTGKKGVGVSLSLWRGDQEADV